MTPRTWAGVAAAAAVTLSVLAAPAAGADPVSPSLETVPVTVDASNQSGWWNPLAVVGGTTYFAYNVTATTGRHQVHVAARAADGAWTTGCLRTSTGACADFLDDNGHNQPSIVVDGSGQIHAFVSMHHEPWHYFRSTVAGDVTSLVDVSAEMPDQGAAISYPVTAPGANGDAWLMVRVGADPQGRRDGVLYHYTPATGTWTREAVIASAVGYSFYADDLTVDDSGRVHILWEWGPWPAGPYRHLGSYVVYDPATKVFRDVAGTALTAPVRPTDPGATVWRTFAPGETVNTVSPDAPAVQTAKMAVAGGQLVGVSYRYAEQGSTAFDVHWATWSGTGWTDQTLIDTHALGGGIDTIAAVDATRSGSETRVYAVLSMPDCGTARSQVVMLSSTGSAWSATAIGAPVSGQQRLRAATAADGGDVLYLSAPEKGTLTYGRVPRTGTTSTATVADVVAGIRGDSGGQNLARTGTATASSQLRADTGPERAIDGVCTDASRWISSTTDAHPVYTVSWAQAQPLELVRVRSGYSVGDPALSVLRDFRVEVRTAAGWTPIGSFTGNTATTVTANVGGVAADAVRLVIQTPSASTTNVARVYEVEAIAATP
ncbi:F5/8 type C domain-containing protein [Microbacterium azadirachtae]|uniref:F5/8 type C domain-containing protein n=1 Tax=Microbacterium azadirachtae TaxID=582680 RepID=A0A1I6I5G5_9MICO|nr:BNR-4 repeat-containing protein [Microbacterium azadirachtae]SFR61874.1 F5/8 type C domain-containing protein [Microbacterium azadirachtae]